MEGAKAYALKLLSSRSHSRKELTAKMLEREHLEDAIDGALDRLEEVELQSDAEFAEVFARSKWRQAKWGPSRIKAVRVHLVDFHTLELGLGLCTSGLPLIITGLQWEVLEISRCTAHASAFYNFSPLVNLAGVEPPRRRGGAGAGRTTGSVWSRGAGHAALDGGAGR